MKKLKKTIAIIAAAFCLAYGNFLINLEEPEQVGHSYAAIENPVRPEQTSIVIKQVIWNGIKNILID